MFCAVSFYGDAQLHCRVPVDADELIVFQADYVALLFRKKRGNLGQFTRLIRKQDGHGKYPVSLDQTVLYDGSHGNDIHVAAA